MWGVPAEPGRTLIQQGSWEDLGDGWAASGDSDEGQQSTLGIACAGSCYLPVG